MPLLSILELEHYCRNPLSQKVEVKGNLHIVKRFAKSAI